MRTNQTPVTDDGTTPDYSKAIHGVEYAVHQHALGVLDMATRTWSGERFCTVIPKSAVRHIGQYVTAFASDLCPALVGQVLVMRSHYLSWNEDTCLESVDDGTGTYLVRPNPETRVGSAGPRDHITLGRLASDLVLDEVTWWATDDVVRMEPLAFGADVAASWPGHRPVRIVQ